MIELNLTLYQSALRIRRQNGVRQIWDPIRKKWLVLQPEEMVRQLLLQYLLQVKHYNAQRIRMERGLEVNTMSRRCDMLVFDKNVQPWLLAECKAPHVPVSQAVFDQAAIYNTTHKAPYLLVTNGIDTWCCAIDHQRGSYTFLREVPDWERSE